MERDEIIRQAQLYFGRNRKRLKVKLSNFEFDGREYREWKRKLSRVIAQPFDVRYCMFDDVVEWLKAKEYGEINWKWLGDLSWQFEILLNENVRKGYDWDKKLALNCGGTARLARFYVSDIIPCFVFDVYYMTYSKKENYFEFGPVRDLTDAERALVNKVKRFFQASGLTYLSRKDALKRHQQLYSDLNSEGNARLFDALFSDTGNYQTEIKRFSDEQLNDATGKSLSWNEFYDKNHRLLRREEYRYFPSKNVECVITDGSGQIIKVKIWRDFEKETHVGFVFDILSEYEKRQRRKAKPKIK